MSIKEGQKIKLKTNEIARIVEVYKNGEAFEVEIFKSAGGITIETINPKDIASVYVENEVSMEKYATI
jgi:hypothetical protein